DLVGRGGLGDAEGLVGVFHHALIRRSRGRRALAEMRAESPEPRSMRRPSPACGAAVGLQVPETAPLSPSVSARGAKQSIVGGMPGQSILRLFLPRVVGAFLLGALYAGARYGSPATGGLVGASCAASFVLLERFVLRRNSGGFIRPLPFLIYFALRSVLYVGVIVIVIAVVNEAAGAGFGGVRPFDLIFSLVLAVGGILLLSVNLLGPGVLFAFRRRALSQPPDRGARAPVHRHARFDRHRRAPRRTQLSQAAQPLCRRCLFRSGGSWRRDS